MKGIEPRFYRKQMGEGRFRSFVIGYKDSDLWIGIDVPSFKNEIIDFAQQELKNLRIELENFIRLQPEFASSFSPLKSTKQFPKIAKAMANAAKLANTGPMAAVAGAFSEHIGKAIQENFRVNEIAVENGGDIYLSLKNNMILSVYAGNSPLSGKVGIEIPAKNTPIGICTSAGTVGPSTSFGKADAVMVISKNTAIADAFATAIGNKVLKANDIEKQLNAYRNSKDILSVLIICEGSVGIKGQFEMKIINT